MPGITMEPSAAPLIAPPSAHGSIWIRKMTPYVTGSASGWMAFRGARRRRAIDKGFVLSDHCDFQGLLESIKATGAGFANAGLVYCDLSNADLSGADFSGADLNGANLHAIRGDGTRWDGARRDGVRETDEALARAERWQAA